MLQCERKEEILSILEKQKTCKISALAKGLFVSESTIRRDIDILEKLGLVKRVHGGVVLSKFAAQYDIPIILREQERTQQKQIIASKAAELVYNGCTIFLDGSTTVQHMIPYLKSFTDLTVITNSLKVIDRLEDSNIRVFCTGGRYIPRNRVFIGSRANEMLRNWFVDLCFFSSQGLSLSGDISDSSEEETEVRKTIISNAAKSYFLCDHSKIGLNYLFKLCNVNDIDSVICDTDLPDSVTQKNSNVI